MSATEGLGKDFNVLPTGDGVFINMRYGSIVAFLCVGASDTYTLQSSATASGGANLACITHNYTNANANGSTPWVEHTQAAAATLVTGAGDAAAVFHVSGEQLPDGHKYIKVTSTGSGLVVPIMTGLVTQRRASNLPALGV